MTALEPDRLDEAQLEAFRRELTGMSEKALGWSYEFFRTACGLTTDNVPRMATMQRFWLT